MYKLLFGEPIFMAADPTSIDVSGVFSGVTSAVSSAITDILPYAAVVLGALLALTLGMKVYRRVVGR